MSSISCCWQEHASGAKLVCGPLVGSVRIDDASAAFVVEQWQGKPVNGLTVLSYFGPSLRMEPFILSDAYIRGKDFVATFAEAGPQKIAPQLYWRADDELVGGAAKVQLDVSVKTDVLDSWPISRVHSLINLDAQVLHTGSLTTPRFVRIDPGQTGAAVQNVSADNAREHLFLFRLPQHGLSFAQVVHPTDFVGAQLAVDREPPYSLLANLFPERLERGVIRRARVSGWFLPIANDEQLAVELARRFVLEPLPLTT